MFIRISNGCCWVFDLLQAVARHCETKSYRGRQSFGRHSSHAQLQLKVHEDVDLDVIYHGTLPEEFDYWYFYWESYSHVVFVLVIGHINEWYELERLLKVVPATSARPYQTRECGHIARAYIWRDSSRGHMRASLAFRRSGKVGVS